MHDFPSRKTIVTCASLFRFGHLSCAAPSASLEIVGLDALVRWEHPDHGLIFPGDFIPQAEEQDFVVPLGRWIIGAACRQLVLWRSAGVPPVPVAINVSAPAAGMTSIPH